MKATTDPVVERRERGSDCLVGLECLLEIVRALGMGSCLAGEGPAGAGLAYSRASLSSEKRKDRMKLRRTTSSSSSSSAVDAKMELWLRRVPGRMCLNGCSDTASLFTKQGKKGVNQDAMIVWEVLSCFGLFVFFLSSQRVRLPLGFHFLII